MPGFQWFGRGILTRTGGVDAQGPIASSSGVSAVAGFTVTAGGYDEPVTASSSGVTLVAYGTHVFTTAADATYSLANPTVGIPVRFVGAMATGSTATVVINTTATLFMSSSGSAAARQFAMNGGAGLEVIGTSSGLYTVVALRGNVVFSSST